MNKQKENRHAAGFFTVFMFGVLGPVGREVQRGGRMASRPARVLPVAETTSRQRPHRSSSDRDCPHQHTAHPGYLMAPSYLIYLASVYFADLNPFCTALKSIIRSIF